MEINENQFEGMDAIDAAIAKARARAAARSQQEEADIVEASAGTKTTKEAREELRAAKKAERDREREEKRRQREETRTSAGPKMVHMKKVEKAAGRLPTLLDGAQALFDNITASLGADQRAALALHIQHFNRVQSTIQASASQPLKVGQVVRITGGDPKFIGMRGAVEKVQRIRCYVTVPGFNRPAYCFVSDVERVSEGGEQPASTSDDEGAAGETLLAATG
jgi:hypothetical protein